MKFANYIQREVVNPVDLQILDKTYNTLEQGHQAAIQATSALQTEMAKLDLNEAESAWRQQKIDEIRDTLENNSYMGNAYHALDDLQRYAGDLFSNPTLLGKLQAQKDYKDYMDNLDRRNDLTEEKKEYYRDVNKYSYNETVDPETGAITPIKWTPTDKEVSEVPLAHILENARKWMIEDSGFATEFSFLDKDGNVVTDPKLSHTGEIYMKKGNQWVKMPEDKVRRAVEASINSIPGARESLQQDYKIAKWRYNKYGNESGADNPLIDDNGQIRTAEEFLEARINPFVVTNTYYRNKPTIEYGNALKSFRTAEIEKAAAAANGSGTITTSNRDGAAPPDIPINPILMKNTSALEATLDINMSNKQIDEIIKKVLPKENINITKSNTSNLRDLHHRLVNDNLADAETTALLWDAIREREEAEEFLNAIKDGSDIKDQAAFNLYLAIDSAQDLPEDEYGFRDKYNNIFNKYWDGDTKAIRNYLPKEGALDDFISYFGGTDLLKSSGIQYGYVDGKAYVQINEENKQFFEKFARAVNFATENNRNWLGQQWQKDVSMFAPSKGDAIRRIDENGNESALVLGIQQIGTNMNFPTHDYGVHNLWNRYELTNTGSTGYDAYLEYVDKLKYRYDKVISQPNLTIETRALVGPTARANELWSKHLMLSEEGNLTEANKYLTTYKAEDEIAKTATINALDLTRHGAYVLNDETNRYEKATSKEAKEYEMIIRGVGSHNDIDMATVYLPDGHGWSPQMTVRYKDGDDEKTVRLIAPGAYSDETLRRWNRNTKFRAQGDIIKYKNANRPLKLTDAETFGDIGRMKLRFDKGSYFVEIDGNKPYEVGVEDAIELRDNYHKWNNTYDYVKAGLVPIDSPSVQSMIADVATTLATYLDGDAKYAEYYVPKLINQLMN